MTLIAPGQVNGELTLWARDNTTGQIYSYPISIDASDLPTLNPTAAGTPIPAEGSGMPNALSFPASSCPPPPTRASPPPETRPPPRARTSTP